jgi:hypothetical protein
MRKIVFMLFCWVLHDCGICAVAQQANHAATNSLYGTNLPLRCASNLKQIYLDYAHWAQRHEGRFPFNVSTNAGGSKELSSHGDDRLEKNPAAQFRHLAEGLVGYGTFAPKILVCPADTNRAPAADIRELQSSNVTYKLFCSTNILGDMHHGVLLHCSIHDWTLFTDGSIYKVK